MISSYTTQQVKERAKIAEVIQDFVPLTRSGNDFKACCPFHKEKTASFSVSVSQNYFKCFGCSESGDPIDFIQKYKQLTYTQAIEYLCSKYNILMEIEGPQKAYVKPTFNNKTTLSDNLVKWFKNERGISQETLIKMKITEDEVYFPQIKKKRNAIQFNYFRDGELVNVKARDAVKNFALVPGAELILYGMDSLKGAKECYWVEGEIDQHSLVEAGIMREGVAVVSVPNGATKGANNLKYIDNCIKDLEHIEWHYLGFDNDPNGRKLREDVAERLGKEKCKYIEWKDRKDANEVLVKYGIQGVIECCSDKKLFPIIGAFPTSTFTEELRDLYHNGLDMGVGIGIEEFDKLLKFAKGYLTVVTGISSHGKSSWLDQLCVMLSLKHNWKFAFYSPENRPTKLHLSNIIRKLIGKNWFGPNRLSEQEMASAISFLEGKFFWIKPEKDFTLKTILEKAKELKMRYGIDGLIIDAYNKLEHKLGKSAETHYVSEQLDLLVNCIEMAGIHCFLVAHPTKMEKDKKDPLNYIVPNLYSIAGSAAFFSKADNGICVYRNYRTGRTQVFVQKVRFSHWGEIGHTEWQYNKDNGRFDIVHAGDSVHEDKKNWILMNQTQSALDIPETPPYDGGIIVNDNEVPF